ncbi:MAG: hypothetical protein ACRDIC_05965 [bacterium]
MSRTAWQRQTPDAFWKQNDTSPALTEILKDGLGAVVDLTGASVKFMAWFPGDTAVKVNAAAMIVGAATLGTVRYTPIAADTNTVGDLMVEWQVNFGGGAIETFPNSGWQKVRVMDDVAA